MQAEPAAQIFRPPEPVPASAGATVFLAGSIDQGGAEDWQAGAGDRLAAAGWTVLNPRRRDWAPSGGPEIASPALREQAGWELDGLERADRVLLYLAPGTQAPISLLELGLFATHPGLVVVCPHGFWRKRNIDILCERMNICQLATLDLAINHIIEHSKEH